MGLESISLETWFAYWTIFFVIVFGIAALLTAENNLRSIAEAVALACGVALLPAALLAVATYGGIHAAS